MGDELVDDLREARTGSSHRPPLRLWHWAVGLSAAAVFTVLANSPGTYVADNRFEQYWNPGRRITRGLLLWDGSRGLGGVREELWPGATIPLGLLRLLGASPALTQHLWHAALVAAGGIGIVVLLRRFRPVLGLEHLLAALLYMFGPYSATFLVPSNLYLFYALVPWLLVVVHRGLLEDRPWRWAALAALWVAATGNVDPPGLVYSAVPVAILVLHVILVDRSARGRDAVAWLARAGTLAVLCSAATLVKLVVGAGSFSARLSTTETPFAVSGASSWSESLRGMGFWVSYFADVFGLDRPQGRLLIAVAPVVLLTFVPPVVALATLAASRWRERFLFGALLVAGAFLMVGGFPPGSPPPWGRLWLDTLEANDAAALLRSTYKAGASLMMGVAVLCGVGVVDAMRALEARRQGGGRIPVALAVAVLVAISSPFWTGDLYDDDLRFDAVPPYWDQALAWLDDQPGDGRVLFLPGGTRAAYRWGRPGDDFIDALLDRPHASDMPISPTTPLAADVLSAVDDGAVAGALRPGTVGPVLRRLGVEHVVVRNDLDWRRMGVARPGAYDDLRADEDLELVAVFGPAALRGGAADLDEREELLPGLEVYRLRDHRPRLRAEVARGATLVSGSGSSWLTLARAGLMEEGSPLVYTATRSPADLERSLEDGGRAVVTDGNRRVGVAVISFDADASRLLGRAERLDRPVPDLFGVPGSQTVARFGDASRITELVPSRPLVGFRPERRPALAFDGDPRTAWVSGGRFDQQGLRVEFAAPQTLSAIQIVGADVRPGTSGSTGQAVAGGSRIRQAVVTLSDGTALNIDLRSGRFDIRMQPTVTTSVELRIIDQTGLGPVAISEIDFPGAGLDLEEVPEVPDDLFRAADRSPGLTRALTDAGVVYAFERVTGPAEVPVERQLRRSFRTVATSAFTVTGQLGPGERPLDERCRDIGLSVDGRVVRVRAAASAGPPAFVSCDDVELPQGRHVVRGDDEVLDLLVLSSRGDETGDAGGGRPQIDGLEREPAAIDLTLAAAGPTYLISGEGFDERWVATVAGEDLGAPVPMDAQSGWLLPGSDATRSVTLAFAPQRVLDVAVLVSIASVIVCLSCAGRRRRG